MHRISKLIGLLALLSTALVSARIFAQTNPDKQREIEMHAARARQALDEKKPDVAIGEYQAILALDPKNVDARGNLGVIAFVNGNCAGAAKHFEQALKLQPSLPKVQAMLGLCEGSLGHPDRAQALLEKSFPKLKEPKLQMRAGMALAELSYQQGEPEKALTYLRVLQDVDPTNVDVLYVVYRIHSDLADQARDKIGLVAPNSARMHQILAQHLINEGDTKRAVEQYREALRIDPRLPGGHFELGEAILQDSSAGAEGALEDAKKEFETALQLNPRDQKSECRLAEIFYLQNDLQSSLAHYTRAAELNPGDAEAQIGLAKVQVALGQPENALQNLRNAVNMDPLNATAHYRLSQLYRRLGRNQEADQEAASYKQLSEAKERLRSTYMGVYKDPRMQQVLEPDTPK